MIKYLNPYKISDNFVEICDIVNIFNIGTGKYWKCKIEYAQYITKPDWGIGLYETHHNEKNDTINVSNPSKGIISEKTPLAKAILGKKVGDSFSYKVDTNTYLVGKIIGIKKPNGTIYGTLAIPNETPDSQPTPPHKEPSPKQELPPKIELISPLNSIKLTRQKEDVCINLHGEFVRYSTELRDAYRKTLKEWRKQESRKANCSAYIIFSDNSLNRLVTCPPFNKNTLFFVNGFSTEKVKKYGEELTTLTKNFFKENGIHDFLYGTEAFYLCLKKVRYILAFLGALDEITQIKQ